MERLSRRTIMAEGFPSIPNETAFNQEWARAIGVLGDLEKKARDEDNKDREEDVRAYSVIENYVHWLSEYGCAQGWHEVKREA